MEALSLAPRKLSGIDLSVALVLSVIAHAVIVFVALVLPQLMPHQASPISFYTVNLVTTEELKGTTVAPPLKGVKASGVKSASKSSSPKASDAQKRLSSPLVPVKRLQFDDSPGKSAEGLKKMETSDLPKLESQLGRPKSLEKDLEKLTKKPKSAAPPSAAVDSSKGANSSSVEKPAKDDESGGKSTEASKNAAAGNPQGSANGSAQASAGGAQVGLARRLYYTEVWNAIRSNWALPDFLKDKKLEAVLVVTVRRDGKILAASFEKRSGNSLFDESAERAVKKADPLPPFPAIYSPPQEQIGVRFRPEDL